MIALLHHYHLTRSDWAGAAAVAVGIALFLAVSPPATGVRAPGLRAWAPVIVAAAAFTAIASAAAIRAHRSAQVIWLAAAAGLTYGVLDALTKAPPTSWPAAGPPRWCGGNPAACWPPPSSAPCYPKVSSGQAPCQ
jgi:hypothetical protein